MIQSPRKSEKLLDHQHQTPNILETGQGALDGLPREIYDDMIKNENYIYYTLMFLNGSVLWAYYSCLSAQSFYEIHFAESGVDFSFLTTLVTGWPMFFGITVQILFGLDKAIKPQTRVYVGYTLFMTMAILIMVFSAINFSSQRTGAILVLVCIGAIGFGNSLTEATYYTLAALFPIPKFTNAIQIGNATSGVLNITIATILRLIVGGVKQTGDATDTSFYLFFSLLVIVLLVAVYLYRQLINTPCVKYLLERNEASAREEQLATQSVGATVANLWRIFQIIWVPAVTQFLVLFVTLAIVPGVGCTGARNLFPPYSSESHDITNLWFCTPGVLGAFDYGDFFGRISATAAAYRIFTMKVSFWLSILRIAFVPLLLMAVAGTSLYAFPLDNMSSVVYNVVLNFFIGLTNGLLATITIGFAPRMLKPEDRESGGAIMVMFLFLGISGGATFGFFVSDRGWFGL